ncbi:unnamed protein product [Jaminaea pallidilutea]
MSLSRHTAAAGAMAHQHRPPLPTASSSKAKLEDREDDAEDGDGEDDDEEGGDNDEAEERDTRAQGRSNWIVPDPGDSGWLNPPASSFEAAKIYQFILHTLKTYKIDNGRRCAASIETFPTSDARFFVNAERPTNLTQVESKVGRGEYANTRSFEEDLVQVFTTFRRAYPLGSPQAADACILQRLYQRLTRSHAPDTPSTLETVRKNLETGDAAAFYASMSAGPGQAERGPNPDLSTRPIVRGKIYFTNANHKGENYRVGDWVHLMNPSDPGRPTIGQIFKICKKEEERDQPPLLSCCWYLRPEQTVHPPSRTFVPNEVFKTGLFADHSIDDVLERVHVLFYTKWTRGRPPRSVWDRKSPLYYCECRYNEKTYEWKRIKNWNHCLPEGMRGSDLPFEFFPEMQPPPERLPSPFLRGLTGPGRLCEESEARGQSVHSSTPGMDEQQAAAKRRRVEDQHRYPPQSSLLSNRSGHPMSSGLPSQQSGEANTGLESAHYTLRQMSHLLPSRIGQQEYARLYHLFGSSSSHHVDLNGLAANFRGAVDAATLASFRDALRMVRSQQAASTSRPGEAMNTGMVGGKPAAASPHLRISQPSHLRGSQPQQGAVSAPPQPLPMRPPTIERSLIGALGGIDAYWEPLPATTIAKFGSPLSNSDKGLGAVTTNPPQQVQWFAGPPTEQEPYSKPTPSLEYLYQLALRAKKSGIGVESERQSGQGSTQSEGDRACQLTELEDTWRWVLRHENGRNEDQSDEKADVEEDSPEMTRLARLLA